MELPPRSNPSRPGVSHPRASRPRIARPQRIVAARRWRPTARPGRGARARPVAAGALLAALAAAWLVVGHSSAASNASSGASPPAVPVGAPQAPATVPPVSGCRGLSKVRPVVHCEIDDVSLDIRLYSPGTGAAAYYAATGVEPAPGSGPATCAQGEPEERAWSLPSAPRVAVGRYRCTLELGHAAMWWTRGDRVSHAVASDDDLAALFTWWRTHPGE